MLFLELTSFLFNSSFIERRIIGIAISINEVGIVLVLKKA